MYSEIRYIFYFVTEHPLRSLNLTLPETLRKIARNWEKKLEFLNFVAEFVFDNNDSKIFKIRYVDLYWRTVFKIFKTKLT